MTEAVVAPALPGDLGEPLSSTLDERQIEALVRRLVVNPHDTDALLSAHQAGSADPVSYARLLERVGAETPEPSYASHWLSEAGNVWSTTLGDPRRAALDYMQAIDRDPTQALAFERLVKLYREEEKTDPNLETKLPSERDYAAVRDVLFTAACATGQTVAERCENLREVADLCQTKLDDVPGAIKALRRIVALDPCDREARRSLSALLEANEQWGDVALLLERDATAEVDLEKKVAMLRHLASLHEQKRADPLAAAEALACVANLIPEAEGTIAAAATAFERIDAIERAARVIADNAPSIEDFPVRAGLLERLGGLRERLSEAAGAGESYAEAAEITGSARLWESAERCFTAAENWERAARAAVQCAYVAGDPKTRATCLVRASDHFGRAGDAAASLFNLELAVDVDATSEELATKLSERYASSQQWAELVDLVTRVGGEIADRAVRVRLWRTAANVSAAQLADKARARELWAKLLDDDGDDREALERLIDDAIQQGEDVQAIHWIERLEGAAFDGAKEAAEAWRNVLRVRHGDAETDLTDPTGALGILTRALEAREADSGAAADDASDDDVIIADDLAELFTEAEDKDIPIEVALPEEEAPAEEPTPADESAPGDSDVTGEAALAAEAALPAEAAVAGDDAPQEEAALAALGEEDAPRQEAPPVADAAPAEGGPPPLEHATALYDAAAPEDPAPPEETATAVDAASPEEVSAPLLGAASFEDGASVEDAATAVDAASPEEVLPPLEVALPEDGAPPEEAGKKRKRKRSMPPPLPPTAKE
jgi:tetratricopeptide (TPR) repeat protein